jgi:ligand-binding sensor domain-containing protein
MRFRETKYVFLVILTCFLKLAVSQVTTRLPVKTLNVADGLPQSFISGLVQDSVGFVWIGTRDGLARYDGIKFKIFRSFPGDTSSLSNNTISGLFLDKESNLWISYETGDIDVLNTATEKLFHFTKDPLYKSTFLSLKNNNSIVEDKEGNIYFLCSNGGIFICNLKKHSLRFHPNTVHGFVNNRIMGLQSYENSVILVTDTALVTVNSDIEILQVVPYTFSPRRLYTDSLPYKNAQTLIRKTGEVIIKDNNRLIIFNPVNKEFSIKRVPAVTSVPLKKMKEITSITQDETGNIFFDFNADIFILSPQNELKKWKGKTNPKEFASISMLIDQAGLLWVGGNGNGIQQFDLRLTKLSGLAYKKNFHEDVLNAFLQVPLEEIEHSFLHDIEPYNFRWARGYDNKIWMSKGGYDNIKQALVCYFDKGHLVYPDWRYTDTSDKNHYRVNAMAFSGSGKLWGIDYRLHPVYFNTATKEVTVLPAVAPTIPGPDYTINSLLIDGENIFWISTSLQGLYRYDKVTGKTIHFTENESAGSLPTNQLTNMINDPDDKNIIWIGSLGGGLIRFNKTTGNCSIYTTNEGLPNNTIYAVMSDVGGKIWCSSNKGFFLSFLQPGEIRSFTMKDGLLGDEFNRFHFLQLPDKRIVFGGVDGYTVFDPLKDA